MNPKIPKTFHQIWLGNMALPEKFKVYGKTWKNLHPDWNFIMWNEENIKDLTYLNLIHYNRCANYSEKSDYLRFCILLEYGGVYIDTDFECLKNIEILLDDDLIVGKEGLDSVNGAFIASIPENEIVRKIFLAMDSQLKKNFLPSTHKIGPQFISKFLLQNNKVKILPGHFLYSSYWLNINGKSDEIYGIHHYTFSWQKQKWRNVFFKIKKNIAKNKVGKYGLILMQICIEKSRLLYLSIRHKYWYMILFIFSAKENLFIILQQTYNKYFDIKNTISLEDNIKWLEIEKIDFDDYAKNIDKITWEESKIFGEKMQKEATEKLKNIKIDLGGGGMYELLYFLTRKHNFETIIETGVAFGYSSQAILSAIDKNKRGHLYSSELERFTYYNASEHIGTLVSKNLYKNWSLFLKGDRINLQTILSQINKIDMLHYDSDKSYRGRKYVIEKVKKYTTQETKIIFDDIQDNSHFFDYIKKNNVEYKIFKFGDKYLGLIFNIEQKKNITQ